MNAVTRLVVGFIALAMVGVPGCGSDGIRVDPGSRRKAKEIWRERCSTCHGMDGDGDGPQAVHLEAKPRRLSDRAWRSTVTDEHFKKVIVEGGPAVGLHLAMAPNPDLRNEPAVLEALVQHIRGL